MNRRTRYQQGSVQREKRQSGPDVWIFRWREPGPDGTSRQRKAIVGTVTALTTEASALKAAHALRIDANQQTPQAGGRTEHNCRTRCSLPVKRIDRRESRQEGILDTLCLRMLLGELGSAPMGRTPVGSDQARRSRGMA